MTKMVRCACGNAWVLEGMCCLACEAYEDEEPMPSDDRLVTDEAEPWFGEMGVWYGEEAA